MCSLSSRMWGIGLLKFKIKHLSLGMPEIVKYSEQSAIQCMTSRGLVDCSVQQPFIAFCYAFVTCFCFFRFVDNFILFSGSNMA